MTKVRILAAAASPVVVKANGMTLATIALQEVFELPKDEEKAKTILSVLDDSNVEYEMVGDAPEVAEEDAPEGDGNAGQKTGSGVDLGILDQSIPKIKEAIEGIQREGLLELLAAEKAGNTRDGAVKAIEEALDKLTENEGGE